MFINYKEIMWYHVTRFDRGPEFTFTPVVPDKRSRLKGEDRITPRICVAHSVRGPIHMMCVIRPSQRYYVYGTTEHPEDPMILRREALAEKSIRANSNVFCGPDVTIGSELWFLEPKKLQLLGYIDVGPGNYMKMIMASMTCGGVRVDFKEAKFIPFIKGKFREKKAVTVQDYVDYAKKERMRVAIDEGTHINQDFEEQPRKMKATQEVKDLVRLYGLNLEEFIEEMNKLLQNAQYFKEETGTEEFMPTRT